MAQLYPPGGRGRGCLGAGLEPRHGAHRGALPPLRRTSRPRLPERPGPDRRALLHQLRRPEKGALNQAWNSFSTAAGNLGATERLGEEQGAPLELALLVESVHFLAVERGVELEMAAADGERQVLDPLHQQGRDPVAAMVPVDDQLVEVADGAFLPQARLERQRGKADHTRSNLGADVPLPRRQEPAPEDGPEGRPVEDLVRPVLAQEIEDGRKIL